MKMNKAFNFTDKRTSKDFNLPNIDKGIGHSDNVK